MTGLLFEERKRFTVGFQSVQRGFLSERKGKIVPFRGAEYGKGTRTNSGKSDTGNLEAESIRSRAESTRGRVKLKTVTEIINLSPHDL